jgi:starvation-inducible DNA-binding protein
MWGEAAVLALAANPITEDAAHVSTTGSGCGWLSGCMATTSKPSKFTVPGLSVADGHQVGKLLQLRLHALNDLQLTLKHAHWNVVGRDFIGVHEMLDPQIEAVREMVDEVAERMATLGVSPVGTPGALVKERTWDDYAIGRASTVEHLAALDLVYTGVISETREVQEKVGEIDAMSEDLLVGHLRQLELFQWFIRAHLENAGGQLSNAGAQSEEEAAAAAADAVEDV